MSTLFEKRYKTLSDFWRIHSL